MLPYNDWMEHNVCPEKPRPLPQTYPSANLLTLEFHQLSSLLPTSPYDKTEREKNEFFFILRKNAELLKSIKRCTSPKTYEPI